MTIAQTFAMIDVDRAEALFPAFVAATAGEAGALFYSMARGGPAAGPTLLVRESHADAPSALSHLANVGDLLGDAIERRILALDALDVYGPRRELARIRADGRLEAFAPRYFASEPGGFSRVFVTGARGGSDAFCTIEPRFEILDPSAASDAMAAVSARTRAERGCLWHGFAVAVTGDAAVCREGYVDGAAVAAHVARAKAYASLTKSACRLASVKIVGPRAELDKVRATMGRAWSPLEAQYFEIAPGGIANIKKC